MSNLTFRKATPTDVPALLLLVRSAYRADASPGWTTEADLVADDRIDEAGLLQKINEPHGQILLAVAKELGEAGDEEQLLACCEVVRKPAPSKSAYLGLFSVRPTLQNGGIGRRVLAEAERVALGEMGAGVMEMWVLWMREELIAYYERRGYAVSEGEKVPFPYAHLVNPREGLRKDLYFVVLRKALV
ncbi:unnamed protein product [Discula destructiva]